MPFYNCYEMPLSLKLFLFYAKLLSNNNSSTYLFTKDGTDLATNYVPPLLFIFFDRLINFI